jgi:hypothetical protein
MCFVLISCVSLSSSASAAVWTYDVPGGEALASPDYEVTVESKGVTRRAFVHHSRGLRRYTRYKWNMEPAETRTFDGRGMVACSWAIFSMSGKVTVRVKVRKGASEITLPLTSAKVLPSSYGIPCTVENGDTITFTLDWPEKVAVVPNYDEAWRVFVEKGRGHVPARSWRCEYADEKKRESYHGTRLKASLSEGYRNLLVILAHPPEEDVPDRDAAGTLVVRAGDRVTQEALDAHSTVYFTPGVHDLSKMGKLPWWQTLVKKGQTVYLEGGSYLKARFKRNEGPGEGEATIRGRGVISGIAHPFVRSFEEGSQVIGMDNLLGVTIAERACFGIYGGHVIDGVAMLAGWHGNTDGPDYLDDCVIRNCFLMAHDDNLKLNHNTRASHLVIWQLANAHAIMVKEMRDKVTFANSVVEDVDIVMYLKEPSTWKHPWGRLGPGAIACVTGSDLRVRNFTFRDIRIESPYLFRVFCFYNMDTNREYAPSWFTPTSEERHTRIDGVTFRNVTVYSPVIAYRSLLGSAYPDSFANVRFVNLRINGTTVTEGNADEFFEIERDTIEGLSFSKDAKGHKR